MKPNLYSVLHLAALLLAIIFSSQAQGIPGLPSSAFPDSTASRLVKTAPVVLLGRPLHSEMFYSEATQKSYISTAVLVLHVLRGDSVKNGTIELLQETPTPHEGVGPHHLFGNRKYMYNNDAHMYFCTPSRLPRNPTPFQTDNQLRLSMAKMGPGLSPTIQFLAGSPEPTRIYGLGREFQSTAILYAHLSRLGKLNMPDLKFGRYQRPYAYKETRPEWIGVPTSPASSLLDYQTPEEIIQARNVIQTAPYIFAGLVLSATRFADAQGQGYVSELVQPVWLFRTGGVLTKDLIEVVETEEDYARENRQNVPVVYLATETTLPGNPATKKQVTQPVLRLHGGNPQAKIMIGKVGAGTHGLYHGFNTPQESWGYINQLPNVTPWLPPSPPSAGVSTKAPK